MSCLYFILVTLYLLHIVPPCPSTSLSSHFDRSNAETPSVSFIPKLWTSLPSSFHLHLSLSPYQYLSRLLLLVSIRLLKKNVLKQNRKTTFWTFLFRQKLLNQLFCFNSDDCKPFFKKRAIRGLFFFIFVFSTNS